VPSERVARARVLGPRRDDDSIRSRRPFGPKGRNSRRNRTSLRRRARRAGARRFRFGGGLVASVSGRTRFGGARFRIASHHGDRRRGLASLRNRARDDASLHPQTARASVPRDAPPGAGSAMERSSVEDDVVEWSISVTTGSRSPGDSPSSRARKGNERVDDVGKGKSPRRLRRGGACDEFARSPVDSVRPRAERRPRCRTVEVQSLSESRAPTDESSAPTSSTVPRKRGRKAGGRRRLTLEAFRLSGSDGDASRPSNRIYSRVEWNSTRTRAPRRRAERPTSDVATDAAPSFGSERRGSGATSVPSRSRVAVALAARLETRFVEFAEATSPRGSRPLGRSESERTTSAPTRRDDSVRSPSPVELRLPGCVGPRRLADTRKVTIYSRSEGSPEKSGRTLWGVLTCKSLPRSGRSGERPIESPGSWFRRKCPQG